MRSEVPQSDNTATDRQRMEEQQAVSGELDAYGHNVRNSIIQVAKAMAGYYEMFHEEPDQKKILELFSTRGWYGMKLTPHSPEYLLAIRLFETKYKPFIDRKYEKRPSQAV